MYGLEQFINENITLIVLIALWSIPWKIAALWKAARNNSFQWFLFMFLINTLGILEILYIFIFSKRHQTQLT